MKKVDWQILQLLAGIALGLILGYISLYLLDPEIAFGSPLDAGYVEEPEEEEIEGMTSLIIHEEVEKRKAREIDQLAKLVHAEAGNQPLTGKRLVADVVLNRVDSEDFPDTVEEVIFQTNQFSVMDNGGYKKAIPDETDYLAVKAELAKRMNTEVLFFTAGKYNACGIPAFKLQDHYFSK